MSMNFDPNVVLMLNPEHAAKHARESGRKRLGKQPVRGSTTGSAAVSETERSKAAKKELEGEREEREEAAGQLIDITV